MIIRDLEESLTAGSCEGTGTEKGSIDSAVVPSRVCNVGGLKGLGRLIDIVVMVIDNNGKSRRLSNLCI